MSCINIGMEKDQEQELEQEVVSEEPEQSAVKKWRYPPRQRRKWGVVTKEGLIVGRGENQRVVPPDEVYKLASLGCDLQEIADWFQVNRETLKFNFSDYIAEGRAELKTRLRQAQIQTALSGNPTLLIWLGKQYLSQSDNPANNDSDQPLPWAD